MSTDAPHPLDRPAYQDTNLEEALLDPKTLWALSAALVTPSSRIAPAGVEGELVAPEELRDQKLRVQRPVVLFDYVNASEFAPDERGELFDHVFEMLRVEYPRRHDEARTEKVVDLRENIVVFPEDAKDLRMLRRFCDQVAFLQFTPFRGRVKNSGLRAVIDLCGTVSDDVAAALELRRLLQDEEQLKADGIWCSDSARAWLDTMVHDNSDNAFDQGVSRLSSRGRTWQRVNFRNHDLLPAGREPTAPGRPYLRWWRAQLERLKKMKDATERGFAFEQFLLALAHIQGGANCRKRFRNREGRELDGLFMVDHQYVLLDAKWESAPVGKPAADALYVKVESGARNAVGVLVSMSGFNSNIASKKPRPLVFVNDAELSGILDGERTLIAVLNDKILDLYAGTFA